MPYPYIGQIQPVGFNFAPRGWALCDGQLLAVATNEALFSLLGTIYGGNGRTTFGLPDLRGRVPMHFGQGLGLTPRRLGEKSGAENVTLVVGDIPAHHHTIAPQASTEEGVVNGPGNNYFAALNNAYANVTNATMPNTNSALTGGGGSHANIMPYQTINWIIALVGIYPSRT